MARQTGKRRRSTDAQSQDHDQTEVPRESSVQKGDDAASVDALLSTSEVAEHVILALTDQKVALEARVTELTMGKPMARVMDPGFDVNGHRLQRTHRDFMLQEMVTTTSTLSNGKVSPDRDSAACCRSGWLQTLPRNASGA